ncbi:MAG TPA: DUF4019 domain-containing protein [Thermoanaerobaculia bacterium]|nr:DUF4019 domain-containing protein [Thermoanaerobaculia bacterium]
MNDGMIALRKTALVGMAAGLCVWAACSAGTGTETTTSQVTSTPTPAPAEAPETPPDTTGATGAAPSNDDQLRAAIGVAQQWLAFVDQGQYAESWSATGTLFQSNMPQDRWVQTLTGARTPLGTVVSREVAGSELRASLPGAPTGQYSVVSFSTDFQNKPDIIETLTMVDEGGQWKVVGYSANPRAALEQQQDQPGQAQPTPTPTATPTPSPMPTPTPTATPPQI